MKLLKPSWVHHDGHPIFSIDIHPDDTHFATGGQGDDNTGRVVIWNFKAVLQEPEDGASSRLLCQLDHHSACVNCVRWSNSGRYLSSGGDDKVIIIWRLVSKCPGNTGNSAFEKNNLEIWKSVSILRGHDGDVLDLAWSPGDTYLASCSIDNTIKIWNAQNFPQVITSLEGHSSMVKGVTWDPVGKYLASQSVDKTLRIWRTSDWSTEHVVKDPFLDCGGTTHVLRLGWSPDGMYLVSAHAMNYGFPTAQIIERNGWKIDKDFVGHRKAVVCVRFNKHIQENEKRVKQCWVAIGSRDRSISVWSTALKRPLVVVKDAFSHSVLDLTWSHCGTIMMACSWDGSVVVTQFTHSEIGKPLSSEETDALYQKFYGNSILTTNSLNTVPNMEIFVARNKKIEQSNQNNHITEQSDKPSPPIPSPGMRPPPPPPLPPTKRQEEFTNKGPTTQIETRTADGKRRITPKFLPLPNEDNLISSKREECTVFKNSEGSISSKTDDNLRESMVSSIEDVTFGENKMISVNATANGPSKTEVLDRTVETPMEVDPCPVNKVPGIVNGIGEETETEKNKDLTGTLAVNGNGVAHNCNGKADAPAVVVNGYNSNDNEVSGGCTDVIVNQEKKSEQTPPTTVNVIQVKKKRPLDDVRQPPPPPQIQNLKKKFIPQSSRTFPLKTSEETPISNENKGSSGAVGITNSTAAPTNRSTPVSSKGSCASKSRLPQLKVESTFALQVNIKPEASYSLEVNNNYKRIDGICHQLKCQHIATSIQGLDWTICTDAPICAISGDMHRIICLAEDATVHILDLKGRYAISPFVLCGYPSKLVQSGAFLLVITVKGVLQMWNIHTTSVVIKSESLLPILNQPGGSEPDKSVDISNVYTTGGLPVIYLSNGKSFIFNKDMCTWTLFSDSNGLVSAPIMPDAGEISSHLTQQKIIGRRRKPEPAVVSNIKLQLIRAIELKKSISIQQWLVVLGKTLASFGLEKELHILCEDLLGPTHSSAKSGVSTWNSKLGGCVDKRTMLREILNSLLDDLKWQDFFCEFDQLLKETETPNSS